MHVFDCSLCAGSDLKPENVLVTASNVIKLSDFGLIKQVDCASVSHHSGVGTINWAAPEVAPALLNPHHQQVHLAIHMAY